MDTMWADYSSVFQQGSLAGPSSRAGLPAGMRPVSLGHSGATGPRPITQSELATALALASTPDSNAVTPTSASQVRQRKLTWIYCLLFIKGRILVPAKTWQLCDSVLSFSLIKMDPSSGAAPMPAGTPVSNDLFSQALQQALQATNMSALQVS